MQDMALKKSGWEAGEEKLCWAAPRERHGVRIDKLAFIIAINVDISVVMLAQARSGVQPVFISSPNMLDCIVMIRRYVQYESISVHSAGPCAADERV